MSRYLIIVLNLLVCCYSNSEIIITNKTKTNLIEKENECFYFNVLNTKIRDGKIEKDDALKQFQGLIPLLKKYYYDNGGQNFQKSDWTFPIQGYNSTSIGGTNGSGYISFKYDYFDGNKHSGHPAHDIFIFDKNQDCFDDKNKSPVNVISMTGGVVVAIEKNWKSDSNLRGGKYIWIFDPCSNSFFYYAHNENIFVNLCDIVKPGQKISTVGRTGLNANKKRSPTHLHLMQLTLDEKDYPRPTDYYQILKFISAKHGK